MLKNQFLLVIILLVAITTNSQTLFSFGSKKVSREEFLKAFNKNNAEVKPTGEAYREYLDLYIRFKIKVQAALDLKLDTLPTQLAELKSFRSQVANNYMNDEASMNLLIEEALQRSTKDIQVSHIYVQIPAEASPAIVLKAQEKINLAYNRLLKGEEFEKVAVALSEDPAISTNNGNIGYITAFVLPYDLESLGYNTPLNKFSKPYRSKIGFHIFKKTAERPAIGKMRAAQILIAFPPDATSAQKQLAGLLADSLYRALNNGAEFKQLAQRFSNDNLSYQNGGEMQEFGTGRYAPEFENAAFALSKDGDISQPIASSYGYHIIKRLSIRPVLADKNNKTILDDYRQTIAQNDRMEVSKKLLLKKILQQTGYKKNPVNQKSLDRITDSLLASKTPPALADVKGNTVLFQFTNQKIKVQDWINYLEAARSVQSITAGKTKTQLFEQFVETTALEYYKEHLETYNKDFAYQLKEFKEGNLLFEIMQRKIWDMASSDTIGLKKYYGDHQANYWWETSADALILTASNDSIAEVAKLKLPAQYSDWRLLVDKSEGGLLGDSGRFELGQLPVVEKTAFSTGLITAPIKNEADNSSTFCYILKLYNNREPRSFNDARGFVINDYQNFLEEKWVSSLKKKYPVIIDEVVFKNLPMK
ncbi:MAG: peptidylprolyl isomerase [Chitinophagaceae bacterium]